MENPCSGDYFSKSQVAKEKRIRILHIASFYEY